MRAPSVCAPSEPAALPVVAAAVEVVGASVAIGGRVLLPPFDLVVAPGELVGVSGPSGAGKSTLLRALAGLVRTATGCVAVGAERRPAAALVGSGRIGFVPQDDIVHTGLAVRRTLLHAARIRLADDAAARDTRVEDLLARLGLASVADRRVSALSGGQRKRVSIAVELLADPEVLLLDEPTSGLDAEAAADLLALLDEIAHRGTAVVLSTHRAEDLERCHRVVRVGPGGVVHTDAGVPVAPRVVPARRGPTDRPRRRQQLAALVRRSAELAAADRLTLTILLGSPVLVVAMMATLFRSAPAAGPPSDAVLFWMAFNAFFFGLTDGLLQVVGERAVADRERYAGVGAGTYLTAKVLVLMPLLAGVTLLTVAALAALDRLPGDRASLPSIVTVLLVGSAAGLAIGLAASASVRDAAQAALALPMICFPQVLFGGAVVAIDQMTTAGRAISVTTATRWTFAGLAPTATTVDLAPLVLVAAVAVVLALRSLRVR